MAIIAVDFDGTCVTHKFPKIGKDIGAESVLKELVANGHKLILWTMRSDIEDVSSDDDWVYPHGGTYLSDAIEWMNNRNIPLWGINENPTQNSWTTSPKAHADLYIDDLALGIPTIKEANSSPYVDWQTVRKLLVLGGYIR